MRVSYSALETYKTCPLKFKYQELDKIKSPKSIEALFGSSIHSALKQMFSRTPLYPTLDEIVNFFTIKWQALPAGRQEKKLEGADEETLKAYFEEGIALLKNFYKKNSPWNFNAVELESRFEVQIEDTLNKKTHTLAGIIDRIDKSQENDVYEIIDYKTSKRMPSQNDLDKNLQLSIYNLGLIKRWPHLKQ
ncbi:MAG: PD-(D/E)XK nuclease family protein, partial [bacterium]|nr:PD-(D/E)XK nuclease family protein [bacterium]